MSWPHAASMGYSTRRRAPASRYIVACLKSSTITISSECNTQFFRVRIVVIASAVIVLARLTLKERKKERKSEDRRFARFSDLPVWYFSDAFQQS